MPVLARGGLTRLGAGRWPSRICRDRGDVVARDGPSSRVCGVGSDRDGAVVTAGAGHSTRTARGDWRCSRAAASGAGAGAGCRAR
jgi:hypothetical protein